MNTSSSAMNDRGREMDGTAITSSCSTMRANVYSRSSTSSTHSKRTVCLAPYSARALHANALVDKTFDVCFLQFVCASHVLRLSLDIANFES
jgi:hypothetical protein